MRVLRLLLGVAVLVQSIMTGDLLIGAMSLFLIGTAVFNIGCCGAGGCNTGFDKRKPKGSRQDVEFEEVVSKP